MNKERCDYSDSEGLAAGCCRVAEMYNVGGELQRLMAGKSTAIYFSSVPFCW